MVCLVVSMNFMHSYNQSTDLRSLSALDTNSTNIRLQKKLDAATSLTTKRDIEIHALKLKYEQKLAEVEQLKTELDKAHQKLKLCNSNGVEPKTSANHNTRQKSMPTYQTKSLSINTFWWPSLQEGGLLQKVHTLQHPANCTSPNTKYFAWLSGPEPWLDTRGLTAWGHTFMKQMMHGKNHWYYMVIIWQAPSY